MIPIKKIETLKNKIIKECDGCRGNGCISCTIKITKMQSWADAGVPIIFWDMNMDNFYGDKDFLEFYKNYIFDLNKTYIDGKSVIIHGNKGTGKTLVSSQILKIVLSKKYSALFTTLDDMISSISNKQSVAEYKYKIMNTDFIVIDEFDSRFVSDTLASQNFIGSIFESTIRYRLQNKMPTIICTNNSLDEFNNIFEKTLFSKTLQSLFNMYASHIIVTGIDFRMKDNNER